MDHDSNWVRTIGRPLLNGFWTIASSITNIRHINSMSIRIPKQLGKTFKPLINLHYEAEEWESIWHFGKLGQSFLDIGANIGIMTVAMSRVAGLQGRVIACEPNPRTYFGLASTLRMNSCTNALPIQALITNQCGAQKFFVSEVDDLGLRSSIVPSNLNAKAIVLPAITIDALFAENGPLHYIKIDAEGAELRILSGAHDTLQQYHPVVQVEVHGQLMKEIGDSVEALFEMMKKLDYLCFNIPTWSEVDLTDFLNCTHCHVVDPIINKDLAYMGYGQVLFIPAERTDLIGTIVPRKCMICRIKPQFLDIGRSNK